jgi:hypothetical protein
MQEAELHAAIRGYPSGRWRLATLQAMKESPVTRVDFVGSWRKINDWERYELAAFQRMKRI